MQTESNQLHSFHYPEMHLRGEAYQLKDQGHEEAAADMDAAADALKKLQTAPLADAELAELAELEQQATPAPWTAWLDHGKVFYGEAVENSSFSFSPANLTICECEQFDREDEQDVTPGTAEDDARFIAAMRNALPGLLARLAAAEALTKASMGAALIAVERQEQIHKHGWNTTHDADYGKGELVQAAATCLSLYATGPMADIAVGGEYNQRKMWPWQSEFGMTYYAKIWAKSKVDKLKVAGALIAAEIDRLQTVPAETVKGGQQDA